MEYKKHKYLKVNMQGNVILLNGKQFLPSQFLTMARIYFPVFIFVKIISICFGHSRMTLFYFDKSCKIEPDQNGFF